MTRRRGDVGLLHRLRTMTSDNLFSELYGTLRLGEKFWNFNRV